jgi:hypothetical protein
MATERRSRFWPEKQGMPRAEPQRGKSGPPGDAPQ